ncbi:MAG: DUF4347 domain-containing protein [Nitrospira sp.]|nr:DUF4347 domain-containing protein [Nitrospira sp.]
MFLRRKSKQTSTGRQVEPPRKAPQTTRTKPSLLSLEPRLMFDAAAAATAAEVNQEQVAQEQAEAAVSSEAVGDEQTTEQRESQDLLKAIETYSPGESTTEVVFVDPTVPDYKALLAGIGHNVEVVVLDATRDGIGQIAESLTGRSGIDAIHLISHGSSGELQLGTGRLTAESMSTEYADELATIRDALSDHADLLVYGCNFAEGQTGLDAVQYLADLTGADVQASTDVTGHISLGGDWEFEVQTGAIETNLALTENIQMNWAGFLGTETVRDEFSARSYGNNDGTQSWSSSWTETDAGGGGTSGGDVRVISNQLRIDTNTVGNAASRGVDLSDATSAALTFSYNNTLTGADRIEVRVSDDGGATYVTLAGGVFSNVLNTGNGSASFDISGHASANTRIQFIVTGRGGSDRLYIDNVQVSYSIPNSAPIIRSNGGGATASINVAENSTTVTTVASTDADAGQTLTYSIVGGADAAKFTINDSTGQLNFVSAPNYEAPTDTGGNNRYDVTVQASDGQGGTDTQSISVRVTNTNETPTDLSLSANTVAEHAANGTVVGRVTGTDPDRGDRQTYTLTNTAGGRFAINRTTGVLTVANGSLLNYEAATSHMITVRVMDAGGLTYDKSFTITLTDANELLPNMFGSSGTNHSIGTNENGTALSSLPDVSSETGKAEFLLPEDLRKGIEITTDTRPLMDTANPGENRLAVVREEVLEIAESTAEEKELLPATVSENRTKGKITAQDHGDSTSLASDHLDFQQPDRTSESAISAAITIGLAGVALQGAVGNKEKMIANIRRPRGHAEGTSSDAKSELSSEDDRRSLQDESERKGSA